MGPFAWWIDPINGNDNNNGGYDTPYRTLKGGKNDVDLSYPKPVGVFYEKGSGRIISVIPENSKNTLFFVNYVGI